MACPKCDHTLHRITAKTSWCPRCGSLIEGERNTFHTSEPRLRELLSVRIGRREMSLVLEQQIRECLYGTASLSETAVDRG